MPVYQSTVRYQFFFESFKICPYGETTRKYTFFVWKIHISLYEILSWEFTVICTSHPRTVLFSIYSHSTGRKMSFSSILNQGPSSSVLLRVYNKRYTFTFFFLFSVQSLLRTTTLLTIVICTQTTIRHDCTRCTKERTYVPQVRFNILDGYYFCQQ